MLRRWLAFAWVLATAGCGMRDATPGLAEGSARVDATVVLPDLSAACRASKAPSEREACRAAEDLVEGRAGDLVLRFEASLARALPRARLTRAWGATTRGLGPLIEVRTLMTESVGESEHVQLLVRFDHGERLVDVVLRPSGRLSMLGFGPAPRIWKPPSYADPAVFAETALTVGREPTLPALLSLPRRGRPLPGAIIVHGSGPADEDCSAHPLGLGNKPCKDLAWGLASRGVAVLRYQKRSLAQTEPFASLDEEVVRDACAARALLASRPEIDPQRIVVIGHSLGGALAPRIARSCGGVAALVLLASPARPMVAVLAGQIAYTKWRAGNPELAAEQVSDLYDLEEQVNRPEADPQEELTMLGSVAPRSYWHDLFALDPVAEAQDLSLPMLVIQGERDYQVALADFELWRRSSRCPERVIARRYAGLDHDLVPGSGLSSHYDYYEARHVDLLVLVDIARFVADVRGGG